MDLENIHTYIFISQRQIGYRFRESPLIFRLMSLKLKKKILESARFLRLFFRIKGFNFQMLQHLLEFGFSFLGSKKF